MDEIILGASIEYSNNENNDDHDGQNFINSQKDEIQKQHKINDLKMTAENTNESQLVESFQMC
ncbi:hypothetical protein DERF_005185 [Dermatophagoides farinae]|uniref:Uncharacterized protein n=1 Tax=Dermatophagoides farinae TaxID=6954 RepID=A0A922I3T3_DERFA|nr:hypothetical protein DERF_005185 [Dermatophagoides farinae]